MSFNRPSDIAVIVGLGLIIIMTFGVLGIQSIQTFQNASQETSPVFTSASNSLSGYKNASVGSSSALSNSGGVTEQSSTDNIIVASFNAVLGLGEMVAASNNLLFSITESLHLPGYFYTIILGILLVVFAIVVYSWWKGTAIL